MKLDIGQIIKTNYGSGPYKVKSIFRGCTCKDPLDFFDEGPDLPSHIHLRLRDLRDGKEALLGFYNEETLKSIRSDDQIILCENKEPIQRSLLFI